MHDHDQTSGHDHSSHNHAGHAHGPGGHGHAKPPEGFDAAFALGATLNIGFVVGEIVFGLAANSVALLADAAHNFGDVLGLLLAWAATSLGRRKPTARKTYGYGRSSILASITNGVVLLVGVGGITWESIQRLNGGESGSVDGVTVMIVASIGILINGGTALLFMRGSKGDLNIKGAFLHMAADAVVSAGVVISGLAIMLTGLLWIDPVVSLIIAVVILVSTWGLLRDSVNLAMDHVPESINVEDVRTYLTALPGVTEVHDLHIWALSTTEIALTVHLVRPNTGTDDALLERVGSELRKRFGIGHATFQVENGAPCALAPLDVV